MSNHGPPMQRSSDLFQCPGERGELGIILTTGWDGGEGGGSVLPVVLLGQQLLNAEAAPVAMWASGS